MHVKNLYDMMWKPKDPHELGDLQNQVMFVFMIEGRIYLGQKIYMMVTNTCFWISEFV